jgi:hypothetical protein
VLRAADATARSNPVGAQQKAIRRSGPVVNWDGTGVYPLRSSVYGRIRYWCL